jgi:hypothetical protein
MKLQEGNMFRKFGQVGHFSLYLPSKRGQLESAHTVR